MNKTKLAIIYYSSTGTNYQMALWTKEKAESLGAEVRLRKVRELAPDVAIDSNPAWRLHVNATKDVEEASSDDLIWADAIIFSSPTRFGVMTSQMKQFLDIQGGPWSQGLFTDKVVTAMSSASNLHGGQEMTLQGIYTVMMHWGAIIVTPGYTDDSIYLAGGNPYGTTVTQGQDGKMVEDVEAAVKHQAARVLKVASSIK